MRAALSSVFVSPHGQGFHYNICLLSNGLLSHVIGFFSQILEGWLSTQVCKLYLGMRSVYATFILFTLKLKEGAGAGVLVSRPKRKRGWGTVFGCTFESCQKFMELDCGDELSARFLQLIIL